MSKNRDKNQNLVYSTGIGRICPDCGNPDAKCNCNQKKSISISGDGIVRIRREVKGRKGKTVTTISGIPLEKKSLSELAADLKRKCGTGGSVKDDTIIIQGDHRNKIVSLLEKEGYKVKLAGG